LLACIASSGESSQSCSALIAKHFSPARSADVRQRWRQGLQSNLWTLKDFADERNRILREKAAMKARKRSPPALISQNEQLRQELEKRQEAIKRISIKLHRNPLVVSAFPSS